MIFTPESIVLLATAAVSALVSILLWRRRALPGGTALSLLMAAVTEWALVAGLEAMSIELSHKILWSKLEYVGSGCVVTLYLFFALRQAGHRARLHSRRLVFLWMLPVINVSVAFTNGWHGKLWTGFSPSPVSAHQLVYHHGWAFYALLAGLYAYALSGSALLLRDMLRGGGIRRRQNLALLISCLVPLLGGVLYALHPAWLGGVNIAPMSFGVSGPVLAVSVIGLRYFDLTPVARQTLFEAMDDGVLVLNEAMQVADINPAARELLHADSSWVGKSAERRLADWPALLDQCRQGEASHSEIRLTVDPVRVVDSRLTPIAAKDRSRYGLILVLRDITSRVLAQRELQDAHDQLQLQMREVRRLQEAVREQAIHDALTGLFNRRYLEETLPRELAAARRRGQPLAVILLDVDHFKQVNDTLGHHEGDRTLRRLAGLLDETTRAGDIACRYGGDEFVLVLPDTSLADAVEKAESLRQTCRDLCGQNVRPEAGHVTLSLGVACSREHGEDGGRLLLVADRALYRAKESGRDRVCSGDV